MFQEGLGTLKGHKVTISVDSNVKPKFCKAHSVPYAMKGKVGQELERLQKEWIIEAIDHAEWAAPIEPVLMADKEFAEVTN